MAAILGLTPAAGNRHTGFAWILQPVAPQIIGGGPAPDTEWVLGCFPIIS